MARASDDVQPIPSQRGKGPPVSPIQLRAADWRATLRRTRDEIRADRITIAAGGLATFWFLAVFPGVIAAVGVLGLIDAGPTLLANLSDGVRAILPAGASDVLTDAIQSADAQPRTASLVATVAGFTLALWGASSGMVSLQAALNVVYDVPTDRRFVRARAVALVLILATAVLGGIGTALFVFGEPIGDAIDRTFGLGIAGEIAWQIARWTLIVVCLSTLFAVFYFLGPNREAPRWQWVSPGGILATLLWGLASAGFAFYVGSFGNYAKTYGSLAGVVVLLLWLYITALAVLLGGELNAELERQAQRVRERRR